MPKVTTTTKEVDGLFEVEQNGKKGYKFGENGFVFTGDKAKEKAMAQGKAIKMKEKAEG